MAEMSTTHEAALESAMAALSGEAEAVPAAAPAAEAKSEAEDTTEPVTETEEKEEKEEGKEGEEVAETPEDAGASRLAEREEALRKNEADFDKRVAAAVEAKLPKFTADDEEEILKHYGVDEDLLFKKLLYKNASDGEHKTKLGQELKEYNTKKEIKALRDEIKQKEQIAANKAFYEEVVSTARKNVEKVDQKELPTLHALVSAGKTQYVHDKVLQEITKDAQARFAKGEQGDVLSSLEALKRVESDLKTLAEVFKANTKPAPANVKPKVGTPVSNKPITKQTLSRDELLEKSIQEALLTINGK
jgi:hypothetical protein